ncbi:MAG: DNA replication/repair protein RecF [Propionibacteriaceae bacterium]|nr:DNA replication/repair protein RecF [Propionibacteriaceae bacterium]
MYLSRLSLSHFRSYESADLTLSPGVNVFVGPNGYGKTNIVEAVHVLATLGSHRVAGDQPLIKMGAAQATVTAKVQAGLGDDRALSVALELRPGQQNKAMLNRAPVRPREILGAVRTVVFAPEDLAIVRGDPAQRRRFIDDLVVTRWPRLAGVRAEYERAVKQKTTLVKAMSGRSLRRAGAGEAETLAVWDEAIVRLGAEVVAARLRTLADLGERVTEAYDAIAPVPSRADMSYQSSSIPPETGPDVDAVRDALQERIDARRDEEIARGVCLVGPHRDDLALSLGEFPVKGYASHGEGWSFALALRLGSVDVLRDDGIEPILILDDVFAELDEHRRARVVATMDMVEQSLVTVAVRRDLPDTLRGSLFDVGRGTVAGPFPLGTPDEEVLS